MSRERTFAGLIGAAYFFWQGLAWWRSSPEESGDTWRYFELPLSEPINTGFTTSLLFQAIGEQRNITFAMVLLSAIAWFLLAMTVYRAVPKRVIGGALAIATLLISLTTPVWSWNVFLYSESFTVSALVIWLAALIWGARIRNFDFTGSVSFAAATVLLCVTRPQLAVVIAPISLVVGTWGFIRVRNVRAAVGTTLGAVVGGSIAALRLLQLQADPYWSVFYKINNYVDKTMSFRAYADEVMPACPPLPEAMQGPAPWTDAWVIRDNLPSLCPETFLWFRSTDSNVLSWTLAVPADAWANFMALIPSVTFFIQSQGQAMPEALSNVLVPDIAVWQLSLLGLILGVLTAWLAGSRIRITPLWLLGAVFIAVFGLAHTYAVWAADGLELERHLMPMALLMILSALLLPATLLRAPDDRLSQREPPLQQNPTTAEPNRDSPHPATHATDSDQQTAKT
jgi:hypothetical protein